MHDRWGQTIIVAFAEHEIEWLKAANTLPRAERLSAFADIVSMTGRTLSSIKAKAYALDMERQRIIWAEDARRVFVPAQRIRPVHALAPSQITPITEAKRMAGMA